MGQWIRRKGDEHKCDYPKYAVSSDTAVGDTWRCACKQVWRVSKINVQRGFPNSRDPREHGDTYLAEFERVPGQLDL